MSPTNDGDGPRVVLTGKGRIAEIVEGLRWLQASPTSTIAIAPNSTAEVCIEDLMWLGRYK